MYSLTPTSYYRLLKHLPDFVTTDEMSCVECHWEVGKYFETSTHCIHIEVRELFVDVFLTSNT